MLSVTHLDGRCEPLVNIKDMTIEKEVNGAFGLSLTSFFVDNPGYDLLENESIIEYEGYEFRVKNRSRKRLSKTVRANNVFFDLHHHFVSGIQGGTRTAEEQAAFILAGTGWTYEVQGDIPPQLFLGAFGNDRALKLIRLMCETLKCEVKIMPNRHLVFAAEIGPDRDYQFRYNFNIVDLTESTDTDDLFTAIKGFGANGLEVEYIAPTASIYGVRYAEPVTDEDYTVSADLIEHIKQELGDRYLPQISIDVSITELQDQGYEGVPEEGERIWLVHDEMGIEISTRVMKEKINPLKKDGFSVTLSNIKPTFSDVLVETKVEIDKNKREYRSRIHQTNENIRLEVERLDGEFVEAYAFIDLTAEQIRLEVGEEVERLDGAIESNTSFINQTATNIRLEVNQQVTRLDGRVDQSEASINILSDEIELNVKQDIMDLEGRVSSAESTLTILPGEIESKVSYTDYNGVEMISRINQTAAAVTITANKIDLNGITRVNKRLQIGELNDNSEEKALWFNNYAALTTYYGTTSLEVAAFGDIFLNGNEVRFDGYYGGSGAYIDFSTARGINWGPYAPSSVSYASSAGDANTLDGYSSGAFSFSGHEHSDYDYVKPSSGQSIQLGINTSANTLNVWMSGSLMGSIPL